MHKRHAVRYSTAVVFALIFTVTGWTETTQCTVITSLPTTITTQGIYCLTSDFGLNLASGNAITITANNVVLDLNGNKIGNLAAGLGTEANGIYANQRKNIIIKNGTIRGFLHGIHLNDSSPYTTSQGHVIEDVRADLNTYVGILVYGRGCLVRRSQVVSTGETTFFGPNSAAYGIRVNGPGNRIIDNDIIKVTPTGSVNVSVGIYFNSYADFGVALGNRITETDTGISSAVVSMKYRDNLTTGISITTYSGGTDAGNND